MPSELPDPALGSSLVTLASHFAPSVTALRRSFPIASLRLTAQVHTAVD
jgi:hypothetical protein